MDEHLGTVEKIYQLVIEFLVSYSFQLLGAMIVLIVGFIVAAWVSRLLLSVLGKRDVDVTLRQFMASTVRVIVIVVFGVIAVNQLGVSITPLIAAIGGLAVGASLAIQGPVSNYGAGLVIILTRMYKVGDTVTTQGCSGLVEEISLATTHLRAEDGEEIVIPNKQIVGEIYRNSSGNRVVEARVGISYGDDPRAAIQTIRTVLGQTEGVTGTPSPQVGIAGFGDSSIDIDYRYWIPTDRYFELIHTVNLGVWDALKREHISIPFPQREVTLLDRSRPA